MRRLLVLLPVLIAFQAGAPPALAWTWPADGPVLRPFMLGDDPYAGGQHRGVDIAGPAGAPVRAPAAGIVSFAGTVPGGGRTVTVRTADGYSVTLVHLGSIAVELDEVVREGAPVGTVDPTGDVEHLDPYVHLGIRLTSDPHGYLDPLSLLPAREATPPPAPPADPVPAPSPVPAPVPPPKAPTAGPRGPGPRPGFAGQRGAGRRDTGLVAGRPLEASTSTRHRSVERPEVERASHGVRRGAVLLRSFELPGRSARVHPRGSPRRGGRRRPRVQAGHRARPRWSRRPRSSVPWLLRRPYESRRRQLGDARTAHAPAPVLDQRPRRAAEDADVARPSSGGWSGP